MRIGIAHCAFDLGRRESLRRLMTALGWLAAAPQTADSPHVSCSVEREGAHVWARRLWKWAAEQDDDVLLLNDDVTIISPDLARLASAVLAAAAADIISLHTVLPEAPEAIAHGASFLASYLVSGPGYILRRGIAERLLRFADRVDFESLKEDNVLSYFAFHEQRPSWHTLPALVKHDSLVPSVAYDGATPDNDAARVTTAPWDGKPLSLMHWRGVSPEPRFVDVEWLPVESLKVQASCMAMGIPMGTCMACGKNRGQIGAPATGLMICLPCGCSLGAGAMQSLLAERAKMAREIDSMRNGPRITLPGQHAAPSPHMPRPGPARTVRR